MKFNGKSFAKTCFLLLVLLIVLLVEVSLFISGPNRKYEKKIADQIAVIEAKNSDLEGIERHVFQYITYSGKGKGSYFWYNEEGNVIVERKLNTYKANEVEAKVKKNYQVNDIKITLGYGYDNPVYVVKTDVGEILFDYDTLEEVFYLKQE